MAKFNAIRASKGLEPNQPTTMLYLHCTTDSEEIEKGHFYVKQQGWAARNHYAVWNNPGQFADVQGYEDYAKFFAQNESNVKEGDAVTPISGAELVGTPDEIFEKIQLLQETISLEYLIVHPNHGGKSPQEVQASLKLFAQEVLPAVHKMETPLHEANLGSPDMLNVETAMGGAAGR